MSIPVDFLAMASPMQEASDLAIAAHFQSGQPQWRFASEKSKEPTLIFNGSADRRKGESAHGNIWLANLDSVLIADWLKAAEVLFCV